MKVKKMLPCGEGILETPGRSPNQSKSHPVIPGQTLEEILMLLKIILIIPVQVDGVTPDLSKSETVY